MLLKLLLIFVLSIKFNILVLKNILFVHIFGPLINIVLVSPLHTSNIVFGNIFQI
jgi:hypothetical protein